MGEAKRKFVIEISQAELACRIFEHVSGRHGDPAGRPYPTSPEKSMEVVRATDPVVHARIVGASFAVMQYFAECVAAAQEPS